MRLIELYNPPALLLTALLAAAGIILSLYNRLRPRPGIAAASGTDTAASVPPVRSYKGIAFLCLLALILIAGVILRFYHLTELTGGLQQDEASIGYEAFCLANYGIDRNGYHYPVYPITWGSGGGSPLLIYLNVITSKIMGSSPLSVRIIPAVCGCLTIVLFAVLLRQTYGRFAALAGAFVLTFAPWHIILSRWSLDANIMPLLELLCVMLFISGLKNKGSRRSAMYCLASAVAALCMYCYGSATLVIPLFLVLTVAYCLIRHKVTWTQLTSCVGIYVLLCLPLILFYAVNFIGLPEISLSWISFPRFTSSHFGSVFIGADGGMSVGEELIRNIHYLWGTLTGREIAGDAMWNYVPGFASLYRFTFPVTFLGMALMALQSDKRGDMPMLLILLNSLLFSLIIHPDTNRQVFLFLPLLYAQTVGWRFLWKQLKILPAAGLAVMFCGFILFSKDYFGGYYMSVAGYNFMPGYGDAVRYAYQVACDNGYAISAENVTDAIPSDRSEQSVSEQGTDLNGRIISTYKDLSAPFMTALFYCRYDPEIFLETVHYRDPDSEFRIADSFGEFIFGLPTEDLSDSMYNDCILVLTREECMQLPEGQYDVTFFRDYAAAVPVFD